MTEKSLPSSEVSWNPSALWTPRLVAHSSKGPTLRCALSFMFTTSKRDVLSRTDEFAGAKATTAGAENSVNNATIEILMLYLLWGGRQRTDKNCCVMCGKKKWCRKNVEEEKMVQNVEDL